MRKRKKKFWQPIVTGFAALYLVSMLLATYYMGAKYEDEFKENALLYLSSIRTQAENDLKEYASSDIDEAYYGYLASQTAAVDASGPFQQFSVAFYRTDGTFLAKTENRIGTSQFTDEDKTVYNYSSLEQLTDEEKNILADYGTRTYGSQSSGEPPKYYISTGTVKGSRKLCRIIIQELTWERTSEKNPMPYTDPITNTCNLYENEQETEYIETDSKIVWEWNSDTEKQTQIEMQNANLLFPYLAQGGYDGWQRWNESAYLQDFDQTFALSEDEIARATMEYADDSYTLQTKDRLYTAIWADAEDDFQAVCYAELRLESHPWMAAMHYLKYVYLSGLALMLTCIAKTLYVVNGAYKQQAAMEEMRRDFTNAMAHELKTPLGVIRGFAENLQERHMENKRDYYLTQIIGQIEEMDRLVTEMIAVSKMDSEQLKLQKEPVSMRELIQEQIKRLEPMIQEKHIQVQYACEEDFVVTGDPDYLAKAVWNLLSNAVIYNVENGEIRIQIHPKCCIIENTGAPLTDEQLAHAFEMFYSGDKSRSARNKHMGLGLFLAKKILSRHGLDISLANTRTGVQVSIDKRRRRDTIK